jgi:hypothetical protein
MADLGLPLIKIFDLPQNLHYMILQINAYFQTDTLFPTEQNSETIK